MKVGQLVWYKEKCAVITYVHEKEKRIEISLNENRMNPFFVNENELTPHIDFYEKFKGLFPLNQLTPSTPEQNERETYTGKSILDNECVSNINP